MVLFIRTQLGTRFSMWQRIGHFDHLNRCAAVLDGFFAVHARHERHEAYWLAKQMPSNV
jgi:hypothetical protein